MADRGSQPPANRPPFPYDRCGVTMRLALRNDEWPLGGHSEANRRICRKVTTLSAAASRFSSLVRGEVLAACPFRAPLLRCRLGSLCVGAGGVDRLSPIHGPSP
jgi:hypothetical protein